MSKPPKPKATRTPTCSFCAHPVGIDEDCAHCGATVQDRVAWLLLTGMRLVTPAAKVLHHLPSGPLARRMAAWLGSNYHATLPANATPPAADVPFHAFDPASQAQALTPASYDIIIIGRGLQAAGAGVPKVLEGLTQAVKPGGSLLFGGDIVDDEGRITSRELAAAVMGGRAGVSSFAGLVRRQFKRACRIAPGPGLSSAMIGAAGLHPSLLRRISPRSFFWYQA
jgi:hypothetical protein